MKCKRCYNRNFLVECKCGCGSIFGERDSNSRLRKYKRGHASDGSFFPHEGREKHYNWKGGKWLTSKGYIFVSIGHHQSRREHNIIMEKHLGRPLKKGEVIHHINGIKSDNRLENLELLTWQTHPLEHVKKDSKTGRFIK